MFIIIFAVMHVIIALVVHIKTEFCASMCELDEACIMKQAIVNRDSVGEESFGHRREISSKQYWNRCTSEY